ncbi:MAG: cupin domain-containing protein [Chloroflexi bacterium]|nr:cupin domain-containing protein [Chloroflexota bacterium]
MEKIKAIKLSQVPVRALSGGRQPRTLLDEPVGGVNLRVVAVEFVPGAESDEHARDWDEVLYYMAGEATVEVTGGESYTFAPGTLIIIPHGLKHRHFNRGKEVMRQLLIQASPIKP